MEARILRSVTSGSKSLEEAIRFHLTYTLAKRSDHAKPADLYQALALAIRQEIIDRRLETEARVAQKDPKRLAYLSMEFLMGRSLENNLGNLGWHELAVQALGGLSAELDALSTLEHDAALGNGGLGRLAACFLDSLATLAMPAIGYGINYDYGLFRQEIHDGVQRERPDHWFGHKSPWLIERPDEFCLVPVYGKVRHEVDAEGHYNPMWMDWNLILGVPFDFPVVGYGGKTVNVLRLFSARASDDFDMGIFNSGDYLRAVEQKMASETISKVLYPSDAIPAGRELRLLQEYFLVACAVRDVVRTFKKMHSDFRELPQKFALQLNDTHPALTVAELMRVLVDEEGLLWETAWTITQATLAYTNHTLLPEALEKWPVPLFEQVLPRHLQIIYEINRRFLEEVAQRFPGDDERLGRMSMIEETQPQQVRMAYLAIVGSHSVNGVAALHSELVKSTLVPDFYALWPERFNNKTNGVTQRRWLLQANPRLAQLITETVGSDWITDLMKLRGLERWAKDRAFQDRFSAIKHHCKERLADVIFRQLGLRVDPSALFDVQIKRIHEYKRQLLNVLHIMELYFEIVDDGRTLVQPRVFVFAGKAAPGYFIAKKIIHLIHAVAETVNRDARVGQQLKVVFLPDYRVSLAETIVPAADLSEQISTAGKEASGTGNMKLAMNGALTIGTLDGANIEIMEEVGAENIFIFGLRADEVEAARRMGTRRPEKYYQEDARIRRVVEALRNGRFSHGNHETFACLFHRLITDGDEYFHLADFASYANAQEAVGEAFGRRREWSEKAILNVARMGKFSSDRTIAEYARDIWAIEPLR